jgi:hypothetical protein
MFVYPGVFNTSQSLYTDHNLTTRIITKFALVFTVMAAMSGAKLVDPTKKIYRYLGFVAALIHIGFFSFCLNDFMFGNERIPTPNMEVLMISLPFLLVMSSYLLLVVWSLVSKKKRDDYTVAEQNLPE